MCDELGINNVYGDPTEKRSMGTAEVNNKHIEVTAKSILMQTNTKIKYWGDAVLEAAELRNLYPPARSVCTRDGDAPRPLTRLTLDRISRRMCDGFLRHRAAFGYVCLVYCKGHKQSLTDRNDSQMGHSHGTDR